MGGAFGRGGNRRSYKIVLAVQSQNAYIDCMAKTQSKATTKAVDYYTLWKPCGMTIRAASAQFKIAPTTLQRALNRAKRKKEQTHGIE